MDEQVDPTNVEPEEPVSPVCPTGPNRLRTLAAVALWFGMLSGLLEIGARLVQDAIAPHVTIESIRTNWHYVWMIPVSNTFVVALAGLAVALAVWRWPAIVFRVTVSALVGLTVLAPLNAVRGLYGWAAIVLACGIAYRGGSMLARRRDGLLRAVRHGLPVLATAVVLLMLIQGGLVATSEWRAVRNLPPPPTGKPNVLLIVLDTVRADHLSLYGYNRPTSPNLERIARRGVRFDEARSTAPWTLPSHASLFTGRWAHQLSTTVSRPLDDDDPTLAEYLAGHGYITAGFVGNTYYCNAWYGLDRGFSRYEDFPENDEVTPSEILNSGRIGRWIMTALGYKTAVPGVKKWRKSAERINAAAVAWLDKRPSTRPFFLFLNYFDAHDPYDPPDHYVRRYGLSAKDLATRKAITKAFRHLADDPSVAAHATAKAVEISEQARTLMTDSYDDCITYLDIQIGHLFDALQERGLLENTIVVVTADHGEHLGEHFLYGHGQSLYRPLVHVPLLVLIPGGAAAGRTVATPVSLRDVPATFADLAGLDPRPVFPGDSLARWWEPPAGKVPERPEPLLVSVEHQAIIPRNPQIPASLGPVWSVTDEDHVYIRQSEGREELYDLDDDPTETNNLAESPAHLGVLENFRARLTRLLARVDAPTIGE